MERDRERHRERERERSLILCGRQSKLRFDLPGSYNPFRTRADVLQGCRTTNHLALSVRRFGTLPEKVTISTY